MKKTTTFSEKEIWKLTKLLNSWSSRYKWGVTFVGASNIEHFLLSYHNALLDHLVKKLPNPRKTVKLYRLRFDEMDSMRKEIEFAGIDRSDTGFNEALDQVREMMEKEKVK